MEYNKRYEVRSMNSINFYDPERGTQNAEHRTMNTEHLTLHPLVALPHLRFMFSAINTKWEGDIGLYVALPLNDQPANDSKSEVEVRLKRKFLRYNRTK